MKVLQITSDYLPNPLWGMGWHVNQLVNALKDDGVDVTVATAYKSHGLHEQIITTTKEQDKIYLSDQKYEIFNDYHKFNLWQLKLADRVIETRQHFDVVHCHNWMSWLTAKELKKVNPNLRTVVTFHFLQRQYELMKENPIPTFHKEIVAIEEDAIATADHIIVLSESQKQLLLQRYSNSEPSKISLVPHSVNFKTVDYDEIKKAKDTNKYLDILFIGRIEKDKGIVETLAAFNGIVDKYPKARLLVVGDGPLLSNLLDNYKHERIKFFGYLGREELKQILMSSHIFCMPSTSENLPLTVLEAMFFGVVPIFSEGPTVPKVFDNGVQGLTVQLEKSEGQYLPKNSEITVRLKELLGDNQLRDSLSKNAYEYAIENYSLENMVKTLLTVYS